MTFRALAPGQRSSILLGGPHDDAPVLLFETDELLVEAPNWSLDGRMLLLNGNGRLWALPVDDPTQRKPDLTKARTLLGWEPTVQLREGLTLTAEYFRSRLE